MENIAEINFDSIKWEMLLGDRLKYHPHCRLRLILTHQRAECHHGEESLQKDPKRVHEGAILATSAITRRRGGGCRHVGEGDNGQPCSTGTCYVFELGGHTGTAPSNHGTGKLDKTRGRSSGSSNVSFTPLRSCSCWSANRYTEVNSLQ